MLRHAIAPSRRYTKASHDVVRHPRLCSDAKILILYVQGLPEGEAGLALSEHARKLGIRGRAFQRLKEQLLVHGYVHERRASGDRGQWATHQLFSNVPLDDAGARELWRRAAEGLESGGGGCSIGGAPGGVPDGVPGGARPVSPRGSSRRSSAPSARFPTVGRPGPRAVGHQLPVDEEREKNSSRPPSEAVAVLVGTSDTSDGPGAREAAPARRADEARDAVESAVAADAAETPEAVEFAEAERVLLSLRHSHRELHLGVPEARALVGQAVEWLRRGVSGADLRRVLTSDLPPGGVRSAVGFLRHRLVQKMPAPVAPAPAAAFAPAPVAAFAPVPVAPAPAAAFRTPAGVRDRARIPASGCRSPVRSSARHLRRARHRARLPVPGRRDPVPGLRAGGRLGPVGRVPYRRTRGRRPSRTGRPTTGRLARPVGRRHRGGSRPSGRAGDRGDRAGGRRPRGRVWSRGGVTVPGSPRGGPGHGVAWRAGGGSWPPPVPAVSP